MFLIQFNLQETESGVEMPKMKTEPDVCENQQESLDGYDNRQNNFSTTEHYPFHYSSYFPNQNQVCLIF